MGGSTSRNNRCAFQQYGQPCMIFRKQLQIIAIVQL